MTLQTFCMHFFADQFLLEKMLNLCKVNASELMLEIEVEQIETKEIEGVCRKRSGV